MDTLVAFDVVASRWPGFMAPRENPVMWSVVKLSGLFAAATATRMSGAVLKSS
jgi:hypothetical protein